MLICSFPCSFSIVLEFQTASSDAILLYLQGSVYADFLALQLRGGILVFSYNLGSGRIDIQSEDTYDDGEIHTVMRISLVVYNNNIIH